MVAATRGPLAELETFLAECRVRRHEIVWNPPAVAIAAYLRGFEDGDKFCGLLLRVAAAGQVDAALELLGGPKTPEAPRSIRQASGRAKKARTKKGRA